MRAAAYIRYFIVVSLSLGSLVILGNVLSGCGQTGPLYLPSDSKEPNDTDLNDKDLNGKERSSEQAANKAS